MSFALVSTMGSPVSEPPPVLVRQLGAALQEPAVEIEHVARVCLTAWWAAKQQCDLAVGDRLLGQVVEDDQGMLTVVHPVLPDG